MTITTWNVNSIRKRIDSVLAWVERKRPDVLCLQETKCTEDRFPWIGFSALGYDHAVLGQPAYNGVAILSGGLRSELKLRPVWQRDPEARSIEATVRGLRILNVYVPYGEAVGTARFRQKLRWLGRLGRLLSSDPPAVVAGDFNVAPDDRDVYDPKARHEKLISSTPERQAFQGLLDAGYVDAFREVSNGTGHFTWWSHRVGALQRNRGLRVDHHLVHRSLANGIVDVKIDVAERRKPNPSDHAPVTLTLSLA